MGNQCFKFKSIEKMPFERAPDGCWCKMMCLKDGSYFFGKPGVPTFCGIQIPSDRKVMLVRNPEPHDIELRVQLEYRWWPRSKKSRPDEWVTVHDYSVVLFAKESKHLEVPRFLSTAIARQLVLSYGDDDDDKKACIFRYTTDYY